jgi:hypothetical protein
LHLEFNPPENTKQIIQQEVLLCITSDCDWESHREADNWPSVSLPLKTEINVLAFTNIILAFIQIKITHFRDSLIHGFGSK